MPHKFPKIALTTCKGTARRSVLCLCFGLSGLMAQTPAAVAQSTAATPAIAPVPVEDGTAFVRSDNTKRVALMDQWHVLLTPDPAMADNPVVGVDRTDPVAGQLRRLHSTGQAAGLSGVLYENRDDAHSPLDLGRFPQLSEVRYDQVFRNERLDHGLAGRIRFSLPVIGNSSTAFVKGPMERSLGRLAMGNQAVAKRASDLYLANHLYVYPEHRDHDVDKGDRLFAMAPFFTLSQGSSYTDQPILEAYAAAMAALRPGTRARAEELGLLAPTLQMVLRRSLAGVKSDADYLSRLAHPAAFEKEALRPSVMVSLANAIPADQIPPVVWLKVEEDFRARPGRDYLARNLGETLFTTPTAIARAWRSFASERTVVLDAGATEDPHGRPLSFHWVVLRGNPEKIRITPLDETASRVEINLGWHDPGAETPATQPRPTRIEIGVFAHNGTFFSAPSFFTVSMPIYQNRVYAAPGDAFPTRMDYRRDPGDPYADPALWPTAPWGDAISVARDGALIFDRDHGGGAVLTIRRDPAGYTSVDGALTHVAQTSLSGPLVLVAVKEGETADQ